MASEQEEPESGVFDSLAEEMDKAAETHPHDIDKQIEMALECPCVGTILCLILHCMMKGNSHVVLRHLLLLFFSEISGDSMMQRI